MRRGGKLLLTGSHIVQDYGDVLGVSADGEPQQTSLYVPSDGGAVPVSGVWQLVKASGAKVLAPLLKTQDIRVETRRGASLPAAATIKKVGRGSIAAIYGPVSTIYADYRYPRLRSFVGSVLKTLTGTMPVEIDAPAFVQLTVRQRPEAGQLIVHLLNTSTTNPLSPVNPYVEGVPVVGPITVRVQCPTRPASVTLAPENKGVSWKWSSGVLTATIESLHIHSALVIDTKPARPSAKAAAKVSPGIEQAQQVLADAQRSRTARKAPRTKERMPA
jgi:hypothetical protein